MLTGNDVKVLSPLGGAASDFLLRNWKQRPRLYIHAAFTFLEYREPLQVIRLCTTGCDFSIWGVFVVVLRGYDPQIVI
jgi:hypothetical protein